MLKLKKNEIRKPVKTISGVAPVAVMLPPKKCKHGACVYCPNLNVPQSYTPKSPVVLRARDVGYDSFEQVRARLKAFQAMNHPTEKIEIIIMGGTFLQYEKKFQYDFVKKIYDALNNSKSKNLKIAKKKNEKSKHRCVALCIETRPDTCEKFIPRLREFGCTRVELGVQILDNEIYKKINRGHEISDVINATRELKNSGFKVGYHIMPGLPGSDFKKDLKLFKKIFSDSNFKPDQLKIYPCQVIPGSKLEKIYWKGKYKPYSKNKIERILIQMLQIVPRYCRVMRIMREIPPDFLTAGTTRIDLRKEIEKKIREKNFEIKEIRFREIGFALQREKEKKRKPVWHPEEALKRCHVPHKKGKFERKPLRLSLKKYKASGGEEFFLEIVNSDDILFGLCRLRIFNSGKNLKNKKPTAIIRELHVYGNAINLGARGNLGQHTGLGKKLISEAEKIAKQNSCKKISVISGVGVREYYKKLKYKLEKNNFELMSKILK